MGWKNAIIKVTAVRYDYMVDLINRGVGSKKTRHAVPCGLLSDLAGILAAIFICYLFFN